MCTVSEFDIMSIACLTITTQLAVLLAVFAG